MTDRPYRLLAYYYIISSIYYYYYHHHHPYHYPYDHFIIDILCYAPSVFTIGGTIQMTVHIYVYILHYTTNLTCFLFIRQRAPLVVQRPLFHRECVSRDVKVVIQIHAKDSEPKS